MLQADVVSRDAHHSLDEMHVWFCRRQENQDVSAFNGVMRKQRHSIRFSTDVGAVNKEVVTN